MRASLGAGTIAALGPGVAKDIDLYLAVPLGLLRRTAPAPVAGAHRADIATFVAKAQAAAGIATSRCSARRGTRTSRSSRRAATIRQRGAQELLPGHDLARPFRSAHDRDQEDGTQVFRRAQFDAALGMAQLLDTTNRARWQAISPTIDAFVGEPDSMQVSEFPALLAQLGAADLASVTALDDATIAGGWSPATSARSASPAT